MYTITVDGYVLDDPRDDEYVVRNPKINLAVNTIGEGSFVIPHTHPNYGKMEKLKSIFSVSDENGVIFRGRMTGNSYDINNSKYVDLEGMMGLFNDTVIRPFTFPDDFMDYADSVPPNSNVVELFLMWLLDEHNGQKGVEQFKLGKVTVTAPNNYISRSNKQYATTWETLKSKLFDSTLGGYLCIRYEDDGDYIDYLSSFELTNTQEIVFGENLLDITTDSDATETYSACIPLGATTDDVALSVASLPNGNITTDIAKYGDTVYSISAMDRYGLIYAPVSKTTWQDITEAEELLNSGVAFLSDGKTLFTETVEVSAVDLHFSAEQVQSFRIYRNVNVYSEPHGHSGTYQLVKLSLDLHNPQNAKITVGSAQRTLTEYNSSLAQEAVNRIEVAEKDIANNRQQTVVIQNQMTVQSTELINTCNQILASTMNTYVEESNYQQFIATLKAELEVFAAGISGRVTATEENIKNVDGDLQAKFNTITKYFTFDINGLTIGQVDNPNKVVIANDDITIFVGNKEVVTFNADGPGLIPNLKITTALNVLGLQITEDETHINCDYVGV